MLNKCADPTTPETDPANFPPALGLWGCVLLHQGQTANTYKMQSAVTEPPKWLIAYLAWTTQWLWDRQTQWDRLSEPWNDWKPPPGSAGRMLAGWPWPAAWEKAPAVTEEDSCPWAETTGWHTEGTSRSRIPQAESPDKVQEKPLHEDWGTAKTCQNCLETQTHLVSKWQVSKNWQIFGPLYWHKEESCWRFIHALYGVKRVTF